jgi:tetratricopeptide (TPR) repeat protein
MRELLAALEKDPAVERRRWAVGTAVAMLPLLVGLGVRQSLANHRSVCGGGGEHLAGIWEPAVPAGAESPRQAVIHRAFLATGKTYAADVFATVSRLLTSYSRSWTDLYRESCEATQVRGEQSAEVLDLRTSCLQDRLSGLRALTDVFTEATGEVVENAVGAANALGSLDRCSDVAFLRSAVKPPEDPQTRAQVERLRGRVADLKALFDAGRWHEGLEKGVPLAAEAKVLGYLPLVAETMAILGSLRLKSTDPVGAEEALLEAYWAADASRHDEVRAEVAANLVWVTGFLRGQSERSQHWVRTADAVLQRIGGHELLQAWLLTNRGGIYELQGKKEEALRMHEEALALKVKALGRDHPDVGLSEGNLAVVLEDLGRNQEALAHVDRSIEVIAKGYGAEHPELAVQHFNRGEILAALGRFREARQAFERARIIWERELGLESRNLAYPLTGIGESYLAEGDPATALAALERAFKIREAQETDPSRRAQTQFDLARALWDTNRDRRRARALAEGAREAYTRAALKRQADQVDEWLARHAPA